MTATEENDAPIGVPTVEQPARLQQKRTFDSIGEDDGWECDKCDHNNFASASECFQCKTSQQAQIKKKKEDPNNWVCFTCGNSNWSHRTVCNKCKYPKAGLENQIDNGVADWTCLNCDNTNRAFRAECNKCKMPKGQAVDPDTAAWRTNIDWLCMSCGNSNYPYRISCNKCKLPKAEAMSAPRLFDKEKQENWLCFNCDNVNLPFRTECNKCKIDKAEGINPQTAFKRTNNDWKCTVCENVNFYYRVYCNKCQLPKAEIGQEVPGSAQTQPPPQVQPQMQQQVNYPSYQQHAAYQTQTGNGMLSAVPAATQAVKQFTVNRELVKNKTDNWNCGNCDNINFPLRTQCNKCRMNKAEALAPETKQERGMAGDGDWRCPSCSNSNYHYRIACNKCQAARVRPVSVASTAYGYTTGQQAAYASTQQYSSSYAYPGVQQYTSIQTTAGTYSQAIPSIQPGDPTSSWVCSQCENVNWPKRSKCNSCGVMKSETNPNWICHYCNHINYSFVAECSSCKAYKDS